MPGPAAPTIALTIRPPLARADLPGLYARVCALLAAGPAGVVCCGVAGVAADAVCVDALARLQLAARRHRCEVVMHGASCELVELVELMGLRDVLPERPG